MTKPKSPSTPLELIANGAGLPDAGAQTQAFWTAQAAAAEHVRAFVEDWWRRRQQAATSAADCCARLFANSADPAATAEAWSAWAQGALERLSEDAAAQAALAGSLAGDAVKALAPDAGATRERPRKAAKNAGRAAQPAEDVR